MWLPEGWDYYSFTSVAVAQIQVPAGGDNLARVLTDLQWAVLTGNVQNFFPIISVLGGATLLWQWQVAMIGPGAVEGSMSWRGLAALPGEILTVQYNGFQANTACMLSAHGYDA